MKKGRCRVSGSALQKLERQFTELHEGLTPDTVSCQAYKGPVSPVRNLGRMTDIQYKKAVTDGQYSYHHPFAKHAQPMVGLDRSGNLVIYAGRYRVIVNEKEIGVKDLPASRIKPEWVPGAPKSLMRLGTLEWIRYASNDSGNVETLKFSPKTTVDHDENGYLHVRGRANEETKTMARKRNGRRRNPVSLIGKNDVGKIVIPVLGVAAVGAAAMEGASRLSGMKNAAGVLYLDGYKKAAAEVIGGVLAAWALSKVRVMPAEVILGVGSSVASMGFLHGVQTWQMQSSLPAATQPGQYAIGPGALPQNYYAVNRAGCAVR